MCSHCSTAVLGLCKRMTLLSSWYSGPNWGKEEGEEKREIALPRAPERYCLVSSVLTLRVLDCCLESAWVTLWQWRRRTICTNIRLHCTRNSSEEDVSFFPQDSLLDQLPWRSWRFLYYCRNAVICLTQVSWEYYIYIQYLQASWYGLQCLNFSGTANIFILGFT